MQNFFIEKYAKRDKKYHILLFFAQEPIFIPIPESFLELTIFYDIMVKK